jgi:hypothetical protein
LKSSHRLKSCIARLSLNVAHFAWLCFHEKVKSGKMLDSGTVGHWSFMIRTVVLICKTDLEWINNPLINIETSEHHPKLF